MGRRKKENCFPYTDIVISTYIKKQDYHQAQLRYSNNIGVNPAINFNTDESAEENVDYFDQFDEDYGD